MIIMNMASALSQCVTRTVRGCTMTFETRCNSPAATSVTVASRCSRVLDRRKSRRFERRFRCCGLQKRHERLGFFLALAIGFAAGIAQGFIIVRLNLSSVGVTLGGLLVFVGIAFVLTESRSLPYDNLAVALLLNERFGGIFSIRSVVALAFFASAAMIFAWTRLGRDIIAIGSDRRAAMTTGVKVDVLIIGIFAFSGLCAALSGVLLSYSLASASPAGLSDVIAPAAAGAILGGISLGGGTGRPLGIAAGAMTLAVLRSGLNAVGAPPFVNDVAMGVVLLTVAILDGPHLARRLIGRRRWLRRMLGS